jgi:hypothetical protein
MAMEMKAGSNVLVMAGAKLQGMLMEIRLSVAGDVVWRRSVPSQ